MGACVRAWLITGLLLTGALARSSETPHELVLIGGPKSHGIGEHDFHQGVLLLQQLLESSPRAHELRILTYPDGWPQSAQALEGAASVVLYFDGLDTHPLLDAQHRAQFERLMARGAGVVALHQASTVPADDTHIELSRWLGGARYGMFDRTEETVRFVPTAAPVARGVGPFVLTDEFYPTVRFARTGGKLTPILVGKLHPQFRDGHPLVIDQPETHPVAWTFERDNGGRAFTFTGLHDLLGLDNPALRKLLLNAILWTAKIAIPPEGIPTASPPDAAQQVLEREAMNPESVKSIHEAVVVPAANTQEIQYPWGQLTWYVSGELHSSDTLTVGQALIKPGQENPRHIHPNCDEVLHVGRGRVLSSAGSHSAQLQAGDTVSIPAGIPTRRRISGPTMPCFR